MESFQCASFFFACVSVFSSLSAAVWSKATKTGAPPSLRPATATPRGNAWVSLAFLCENRHARLRALARLTCLGPSLSVRMRMREATREMRCALDECPCPLWAVALHSPPNWVYKIDNNKNRHNQAVQLEGKKLTVHCRRWCECFFFVSFSFLLRFDYEAAPRWEPPRTSMFIGR